MGARHRIVSEAWATLSALARGLERAGLASPRTRLPGTRVISVGNLQAGGAGKTPLVARIALEARERRLRAAILCRGYGGAWERTRGGGVIAPGDPAPDPALSGDEAALLHELAPDAWIGVGADRSAQFTALRERAAAAAGAGAIDLVILDDGFQNRRVVKDVEVVALTSARRGETWFRDRPSALARADLVVWTKGDRRPDGIPAGKPLARVRFALPPPPSSQAGAVPGYWLVTGLGDGQAARASIEAAGYRVTRHLEFGDHARYRAEGVRAILEDARVAGGFRVAVTGKDWVKWRSLGVSDAEVTVLEPRLEFIEGKEHWDRILWNG